MVTAPDFVSSWRRTLDPRTASAYNYQLFSVTGAEDFANGKTSDFATVGVKALDDSTLRVASQETDTLFPRTCAHSRRSFPFVPI